MATNNLIRPCPQSITAAIMELLAQFKCGEITAEEFNQKLNEIQYEFVHEKAQVEK